MIDIPTDLQTTLAGSSFRMYFRLQSWRSDIVLAEDIPAVEVLEEQDSTLRVPERLTFKVPAIVDGVSWVPTSYNSPLGTYGQRILAQVGIDTVSGAIIWLNRGVFLLESSETDGQSITCEALGLLQLLDEAELATEFQPTAGATLGSTLRQLIEPGITVDTDSAPADRSIPSGAVTWSDNRLDCVYTILDAWPARARIDESGHLDVQSPYADPVAADVVFAFNENITGTVMEYSATVTRDGAYNCVIAEGAYADDRGALAGLPIVHTALDTDSNSPFSLAGEFSPYLVPYKFDSPLLVEHTQVLEAAYAKLAELKLKASRSVEISCVPHPALQLGDPVSVTSARLGLSAELGRISAFSLPYSAEGGAMSVTVRLIGIS